MGSGGWQGVRLPPAPACCPFPARRSVAGPARCWRLPVLPTPLLRPSPAPVNARAGGSLRWVGGSRRGHLGVRGGVVVTELTQHLQAAGGKHRGCRRKRGLLGSAGGGPVSSAIPVPGVVYRPALFLALPNLSRSPGGVFLSLRPAGTAEGPAFRAGGSCAGRRHAPPPAGREAPTAGAAWRRGRRLLRALVGLPALPRREATAAVPACEPACAG